MPKRVEEIRFSVNLEIEYEPNIAHARDHAVMEAYRVMREAPIGVRGVGGFGSYSIRKTGTRYIGTVLDPAATSG